MEVLQLAAFGPTYTQMADPADCTATVNFAACFFEKCWCFDLVWTSNETIVCHGVLAWAVQVILLLSGTATSTSCRRTYTTLKGLSRNALPRKVMHSQRRGFKGRHYQEGMGKGRGGEDTSNTIVFSQQASQSSQLAYTHPDTTLSAPKTSHTHWHYFEWSKNVRCIASLRCCTIFIPAPALFNPLVHDFARCWKCLMQSSPWKHHTLLGLINFASIAECNKKWSFWVMLNSCASSSSWKWLHTSERHWAMPNAAVLNFLASSS